MPDTTNRYIEGDHQNLVEDLAKDGDEILAELSYVDAEIWHMATGICTEAGELLDAVKKRVIYAKELDRPNVIEELGDLEFYMEGLRQVLGIDRNHTLEANITKLRKRYGAQYSNEAAIARADKEES